MKKAFNHSREIMLSVTLLLCSFVFMSGSCDKDDDNKNTDEFTLTANASGANEFPPTTATGTGTLTGTYNKSSNKLTYALCGQASPAPRMHCIFMGQHCPAPMPARL